MKPKLEVFCTFGPRSLNKSFLKFTNKKVDLVRTNLSHVKPENLQAYINRLKKNTNVDICIDTEGAQIRTKIKKVKKIKKKDDLKTLLEKTHKIMFTQSVYVLKKVLSNVDNLRLLIERNKKIKWSKYLMTRKKLDKLYKIKFPITKADFVKKIRSLQFKEYRLFIKINNKKFFIN